MTDEAEVPGPDSKVICEIAGLERCIGLELCEYQVDADPTRGSKGRQFEAFFWGIWKHLGPALSAETALSQCGGMLFFDWGTSPNSRDANLIGEQIIAFLRSRLAELEAEKMCVFRRKLGPKKGGDFDSFPALKRHFKRIGIRKHTVAKGPFLWSYNSAAFVGIVESIVLQRLRDKTGKSNSYDWTGVDEKWLLICAGVGVPSDGAALDSPANLERLRSAEIRQAAANCGFDRVYFWERRSRHYEVLFCGES